MPLSVVKKKKKLVKKEHKTDPNSHYHIIIIIIILEGDILGSSTLLIQYEPVFLVYISPVVLGWSLILRMNYS